MRSFLFGAALLSVLHLEAQDDRHLVAAKSPILAVAPRNQPQAKTRTPLVPFGRLNFGLTLGYGRTQVSEDNILNSSALEPLLSNILSTKKRSGGFAWRMFGNLLVEITPKVYIGPEIGFTHYPRSQFSQMITLPFENAAFNVDYKTKSSSYGTDGLLNLTFFIVPEFSFSIRPGFQFAYQKNKVSSSVDASSKDLVFSFPTNPTYRNTDFLPEIIVSAAWCFFDGRKNNWKYSDVAFIAEITYQHVFGHDSAPVNCRVNSRDLFGITFGVMF
jgi:hypothetical protein